jgi:hypothetical protein
MSTVKVPWAWWGMEASFGCCEVRGAQKRMASVRAIRRGMEAW